MLVNLSGERLATLGDAKVAKVLAKLGLGVEDVTELDVSSCGLKSLDGIQKFVNLHKLYACDNKIGSFSPLWGLRKLRVVKLRRNELGSIWLRHAGRATVIAGKGDVGKPTSDVGTAEYSILDLESNHIDCVRAEPLTSINVECLLFANNNIVDISGIGSFKQVNTIDFTGNTLLDASALLFMGYKPGLSVFLQGCEISNQESLMTLLERDQEAEIIAPGEVSVDHPRMVKIRPLDLKRLCEKEFVEFGSEFADFRYVGDMVPCELKTPRDHRGMGMNTSQFVVRAEHRQINQVETISTVIDVPPNAKHIHRTVDNIRMCSTIGSSSETATPMSINTMVGEAMPNTATPSSRSLLSDDTAEEVEMIASDYVKEVLASSAKMSPAKWVDSASEEFFSQFECEPDTSLNP